MSPGGGRGQRPTPAKGAESIFFFSINFYWECFIQKPVNQSKKAFFLWCWICSHNLLLLRGWSPVWSRACWEMQFWQTAMMVLDCRRVFVFVLFVVAEAELMSAVKEPALVVVVVVVALLLVVSFPFLPASQCILVHVVLCFPPWLACCQFQRQTSLPADEWRDVIGLSVGWLGVSWHHCTINKPSSWVRD